ncbi:hypothetical protein HAL013_10760 [Helicobacter ailurogastricus]|uniref:Uncharacterized protein n=1 Tax=Helicobacter ailurogastricus TaxID=1578720 RepID=A0A0K2X6A3_9HELI|nr:hypothetical protein HAL011_01290 [Helicobacter ailurogastricus]CRF42865.1 hypothetical protein HAL013_10760 [Helicobacter ailurogastricus]CRF43787.1 hypothetical protein HAL09_03390 [Helicobacter ailurogastricus]
MPLCSLSLSLVLLLGLVLVLCVCLCFWVASLSPLALSFLALGVVVVALFFIVFCPLSKHVLLVFVVSH